MRSVRLLFQLMRPEQWLKNLMLFFPPFLSGSLASFGSYAFVGISSYISFCFISSALYVYNDICDAECDAAHPVKRLRPLPSGNIARPTAITLVIALAFLGIVLAILASTQIVIFLLLYSVVTIAYSVWLKNLPVIDLFCISLGFIVRLQAGGAVFNVAISEWLFLSVFFLSLFLSSGKRLAEQKLLGDKAASHRNSLSGYPDGTLSAILNISAATVLVTYTMYSITHPRLVFTVPLCTFGLFRYILRVNNGSSGDPTESLLHDIPLLCVSVLWVLLVGWSIYK